MTLYFVTGNQNKVREAQAIIPELKHYELDVEELQTLDKEAIVKHKMAQARKHLKEPFILEDVSLEIESLNGFPGPLIKFFLKTLTATGIAQLCKHSPATATCTIGYYDGEKEHIITGVTKGTIVAARGEGWGFNAIFEVEDTHKTFAQLHEQHNMEYTHRTKALKKLKQQL